MKDGHETKSRAMIAGHSVTCSKAGVLVVDDNINLSVLPVGTHAHLNVLGSETKKQIVKWWKSVR